MSTDLDRLRRLGHQHHLAEVLEAADELEHLRQAYQRNARWRDVLLGMSQLKRVSDQTIEVTFPSCRMAGVFEQLVDGIEEIAP
ncbi:hypothetical protein [Billgrantia gudaonensis]|uniref:Uncharacterized protein n=1 Tax=Billgrantia gudaonensis TaxID=376427 RepID=A0A1G8XG86_9GAMM|nr:hypothetical protein [Halomonas gudaonensis]SDJ89407.1 hypothetical protein SAMN04487954_10927 [Halomonas gudaonensis]